MNLTRVALRSLVAGTVGLTAGAIAEHFAAEVYVAWYMNAYGIATRVELGEDLGFGVLGLAISAIAFLAAFLVVTVLVWKKMQSVSNKTPTHA